MFDPGQGTFTFVLPRPALSAGIVDPEATIENPANTAWGEPPERLPEDIGTVRLSEDKLKLEYTPGPKAEHGLLYVLFDADVDPQAVTIERGSVPLVTLASRGRLSWKAGRNGIDITPGTIVIPPVGEGPRIRAMMGTEDFDLETQRQMLCDLGYLKCDEQDAPAGADGAKAPPHDED
jgi:hypothetical protein